MCMFIKFEPQKTRLFDQILTVHVLTFSIFCEISTGTYAKHNLKMEIKKMPHERTRVDNIVCQGWEACLGVQPLPQVADNWKQYTKKCHFKNYQYNSLCTGKKLLIPERLL